MAVALLLVFGLRTRFEKIHPPVKRAIIFLLLALALEQVAHYRADARIYVAPRRPRRHGRISRLPLVRSKPPRRPRRVSRFHCAMGQRRHRCLATFRRILEHGL